MVFSGQGVSLFLRSVITGRIYCEKLTCLIRSVIMKQTIKLVIADDHNLFIEGLMLLMKDVADVEIVSVANTVKELLDLMHMNYHEIILLDINMPGMSGLDAVKLIKRHYTGIKIIMLSTYNEEHVIEQAKTYGADGYLLKNANKEELLDAIRLVHKGQTCFPTPAAADHSLFNENDHFLIQFKLTKRERELLQFIKDSQTNQQIADQLHLSIYTVETHRKNIMQKLRLKSPGELMRFIFQNNL